MSPYDALLLWVSEQGRGSLPALNSAAEWTSHLVGGRCTARGLVDDLQILGHITCVGRGWQVTPPTWTRLADGGGNGMLFGGRPRWLTSELADLDASNEPAIRKLADFVYECTFVPQAGPATWYLSAGPGDEINALATLGVRTRDDIAGGLIERLLSERVPGQERTVRPGELLGRLVDHSQFCDGGPEWAPTADDGIPGVYRYLRNNQFVLAAKGHDARWIERDFRWAMWLAQDSGQKRLSYSPSQKLFTVGGGVRLPMEVERALVMRSGRLPDRDETEARYENVNLAFAETVAKVLRREVELN